MAIKYVDLETDSNSGVSNNCGAWTAKILNES